MGNPTGKGLKPIKPGEVRNPYGMSKKKRDQLIFKRTSYEDFIDKLQKYGSSRKSDLEKILKDPATPAFDLMFIKIIYDAILGKGDARSIVLDRLWGRVKERIEYSSPERAELARLPMNELIKLASQMVPELKQIELIGQPIEE